jgi:hypothetical protein
MAFPPDYGTLINQYLVVLHKGLDANVNAGVGIADSAVAWQVAQKAIRVIQGQAGNAADGPQSLDTQCYCYIKNYFGY